MREVSQRPTTGQFVEMWCFGGEIWSVVVKVQDGVYMECDICTGTWNRYGFPDMDRITDLRWFVANDGEGYIQ